MSQLEKCFKTNINVFCLKEDETVRPCFKSRQQFPRKDGTPLVMNLNLYENHLSYIKKLNSYCKKFECILCGRLFGSSNDLNKHIQRCDKAKHLKFPGGYFSPTKTIFEKLNEIGISVDPSLQYYPWLLTWDMEAILVKPQGEGEMWKAKHRPICVCMTSNVVNFEEMNFILDPNEDILVKKMVKYMTAVSNRAYELAKERWRSVFEKLEALEQKWGSPVEDSESDMEVSGSDDFRQNCSESAYVEPPSKEFLKAMSKENTYFSFLKRIETHNEINVKYNDWVSDESNQGDESCSNANESTNTAPKAT